MKRIYLLLLCCAIMCASAGCLSDSESGDKTPVELPPKVEPYTVEDGVFDVDAVRSNINMKGMHFDLPLPLSDLDKGWKYELYDRNDYGLSEGSGYARLKYNGSEMAAVSLENCYTGKEKESVIYSISITRQDCDIYGIVPSESTAADVEKLLGKPDEEQTMEIPFKHTYTYGILKGEDQNDVVRGHYLIVDFDENGIVDFLKLTYSDISEAENK
ncbi:MAG: hypothetical protein IKW96_01535 [Ruminococcus sp.]|uniref:hypothetical protein n=1 Tax=Ruminococcus sp. TaxID=41978 RepID=UPI0025DC9CF0|nr:hypothetical protein [Ruminococcus sp.]MBR5681949.1 hypothetical protein [Ruminococcus sp.]